MRTEIKRGNVEFVKGFKTTDGKIHTDEQNANYWQQQLDFKTWCDDNICRGGEWSSCMVAEAILDGWNVTPRVYGVATQEQQA